MKKDKKTLLIIAAVAVVAFLLYRRGTEEPAPAWGKGVQMAGDAMVKVNETLNEGLRTIFNYSNRQQRAAESYAEIDDHHAKSALYSTRNFF